MFTYEYFYGTKFISGNLEKALKQYLNVHIGEIKLWLFILGACNFLIISKSTGYNSVIWC